MADKLLPSDMDFRHLVHEIAIRLPELEKSYYSMKKIKLDIPPELQKDMDAFVRVHDRHQRGDFQNTKSEDLSVKTIAQWSCDANCVLRNQPMKTLKWKD